jgi:hypothetical protein
LPAVAVGANGVSGMIQNGLDGYLTGLDRNEFIDKIMMLMDSRMLYNSFSEEAVRSSKSYSSTASASKLETLYKHIVAGTDIEDCRSEYLNG